MTLDAKCFGKNLSYIMNQPGMNQSEPAKDETPIVGFMKCALKKMCAGGF
jgi:hypothetical protein